MRPVLASGPVWHERSGPGRHAFSYFMPYLWCDLDALDRGEGFGPWISPGPSLFRLRREDHLTGTPGSWREGIETWLERGGTPTAPRIHLLTLPRLMGRIFNPVSFWIGRDVGGVVLWMVAEVNNTFGERQIYLLDDRRKSSNETEWISPKAFHVSPFHGVEGEYRFRLKLSEREILLGIDLDRHGEPTFSTGMRLRLEPITAGRLFLLIPSLALSASLVVPRILWQAAVLHFRGRARLRPYSRSSDPMTIHRTKPVLLQRLFANRTMGRLWTALGRSGFDAQPPTTGTGHGNGTHPRPRGI